MSGDVENGFSAFSRRRGASLFNLSMARRQGNGGTLIGSVVLVRKILVAFKEARTMSALNIAENSRGNQQRVAPCMLAFL